MASELAFVLINPYYDCQIADGVCHWPVQEPHRIGLKIFKASCDFITKCNKKT